MKPSADKLWRNIFKKIFNNASNDWFHGQQPWLVFSFYNLKRVGRAISIIRFKKHFQFSCSLSFKTDSMTHPKQSGNRVKKSAAT